MAGQQGRCPWPVARSEVKSTRARAAEAASGHAFMRARGPSTRPCAPERSAPEELIETRSDASDARPGRRKDDT
jgi:hypothetical protein